MTLKEAAELLGVTPDNLRGAIARGALRATKVGRDWTVEPWAAELYRRNHLRDQTIPYIDMSYRIELRVRVRNDGSTAISAMADVSREGSGPFAEGDTVDEAIRKLREHMGRIAEPWTDVDLPEGALE